METNKAYSAPAILEETVLEVEAGILTASLAPEIDNNFEVVETMGQEIGGTIGESDWSQKW